MSNLIAPITEIANNVLDKFVEDKDLRTKLSHDLQKELIQLDKEQIKLNAEEAKHHSLFVSGWRPSVGWCCSIALCAHFIIFPFGQWVAALFGSSVQFPEFDFSQLSTILLSLLGMSGLRTYEKFKGVNRD